MKRMLKIGVLIIMCIISKSESTELVPSFGFAPLTFPRDPVEINQFSEHMMIGQVLLPLVDTDQFGNMIPAIAKKWSFDKAGTKIIFEINTKLQFSDGSHVAAKDVEYTIQRHINSSSQSKSFLDSVKNIKAVSDDMLMIELNRPDVSILKALSRDQLGIVPKGWKFDKTKSTPFVGAGAYNLEKIGNDWFFIANKYFSDYRLVDIKKAKIIFYKDDGFSVDLKQMADIVPLINKKTLDNLKAENKKLLQECSVAEEMTFSQSSAWWNPKSKFFEDREVRARVLKFLDELFILQASEKNKLATGFIPIGVMGHLQKRISLDPVKSKFRDLNIRISTTRGIFEELFSSKSFIEKSKSNHINFSIQYINPSIAKQMHEEFKPDITIGSWGGGFNDPTGFLGPLEEDLGMPFQEYLGTKKINFLQAQATLDWNVRAKIFNELAKYLVEDAFMLPGFRNEQYSCIRKPYVKKVFSVRYTPRLFNYKEDSK